MPAGNAHRILRTLYDAFSSNGPGILKDPGSGGSIKPSMWAQFCAITTATGETRTLAQPNRAGIMTTICLDSDGGDLTLTVTGGYNNDDDTAIVFDDAGDMVVFLSIKEGSSYYWRAIAQEGTDVSVEEGVFDTISHQTTDLAESGAGMIGTGSIGAPVTNRYIRDGIIITDIKVDLTGIASVATAADVLCLTAGGAAFIGRYVIATYGVLFKMELICLETPATGDNNIDVAFNTSGALTTSGAAGTDFGINGGDQVAGQVVENLVQANTDTHYIYMTAGEGDVAGTYTAGMFIVRLHGHPVLA